MKHTHTLAALIATVALLVPVSGATASAASAAPKSTSVAVRSFPAQRSATKSGLLSESVSLTSSSKSNWGGVESLNVPKTQSNTERRQAAQQEAARQQAQQQAASRSQQRQSLSSSSSLSSVTYDDTPSSQTAAGLASFAQQFTSVMYVHGGNTPAGWDCSGFTQWIFAHFGVSLPRTAAEQRAYAKAHGHRHSTPQVGDLMAMNDNSHMAIYLGNGMMMHAPLPGMNTQIIPVYSSNFEYYGML